MDNWKYRVAAAIFCLGLVVWSVPSRADDPPPCISDWIALGQRSVTPAEVIGKPGEHLELPAIWRGGYFQDDNRWSSKKSYLITGNRVDLVAKCEGYAYVRFHGPQRVSTGWVDASRIKPTGPAYVPLPPNAAALCQAAEQALNKGGDEPLHPVPTTLLDQVTSNRLGIYQGETTVAFADVEGRHLAMVTEEDSGTCHSSRTTIYTGDLKSLLSPEDQNDRHIDHTEDSNGWDFGLNEQVVMVLDQPMLMSKFAGATDFFLSTIDKDGDLAPTCTASLVPMEARQTISAQNSQVCQAVLDGAATPLTMHDPAEGESLLVQPDPQSRTSGQYTNATHTAMHFKGSRASEANFNLYATGDVDMDNTGKVRRVGLLSFTDNQSSAGCGTYEDSQIVPLYLNKKGVADASAPVNKALVDGFPHGMKDGRFVSYKGDTYVELSPEEHGPSSEVWKVDAKGPHQVCAFQLKHFVVRPISELKTP